MVVDQLECLVRELGLARDSEDFDCLMRVLKDTADYFNCDETEDRIDTFDVLGSCEMIEIAIRRGNERVVQGMLDHCGLAGRMTLMLTACSSDNTLVVDRLLRERDMGVDVPVFEELPIAYAVDNESSRVLRLLLDAGTSVPRGLGHSAGPEVRDMLADHALKRAFSSGRRWLAALTLQQAWRRCVADPEMLVCRKRLEREFVDLSVHGT